MDLFLAGTALILLAPLLAVLALAVWVSSGRPILFRQTRVGWRGRDFTLLKFRTMTVQRGTEAGSFDAGSTRRVTAMGRWLRRTKLDELPQLWNVLRGDMALVGPRPEVRPWTQVYAERWAVVHSVRPGITDPAAIVFRHEEELLAQSAEPERAYRDVILPQKLDLYERYVQTRSLIGDLRILGATFFAVLGWQPESASGADARS